MFLSPTSRPAVQRWLLLAACLAALLPASAQRPLVTAADLQKLMPHLNLDDGRPVANAEALALKLAPFRTNLATLSRDGRYVAYTVTEGPYTRVDIVSIDNPDENYGVHLGDLATAEVLALEWTSPRRLVLATEDWVIAAIDLGADQIRPLLSPRAFKIQMNHRFLDLSGDAYQDLRDNPFQTYELDQPPRFIGVNPDGSDSVIVAGVAGDELNNASLATVRLDMVSGNWSTIDEVRITSPATKPVVDRQGHIRFLADRTKVPFNWRGRPLTTNHRLQRWSELDRVIAPAIAASFETHPSQLWQGARVPLGFAGDPETLYLASFNSAGRATLERLNVISGELAPLPSTDTPLALPPTATDLAPRAIGRTERNLRQENAAVFYTDFRPQPPALPFVLDRTDLNPVGLRTIDAAQPIQWLDADLGTVALEIANQFPDRRVEVLDWSDDRNRFLVRVDSLSDPGRYFVHDRSTDAYVEYVRRMPRLGPESRHQTMALRVPRIDGLGTISARLTTPKSPIISPAPLVCLLPDGPWVPVEQSYSQVAQMLAEFGCVVLQLEPPGSIGWDGDPLHARSRPDQAAAADLAVMLDFLVSEQIHDPRRVALVGVGYGAWLALRSAELLPDRIRCVVSLNGINDLHRLREAPPPRELPETRSRNLEAAQAALALHEATLIDTSNLANTGYRPLTTSNIPADEAEQPEDGGDYGEAPDFNLRSKVFSTMLDRLEIDPVGTRALFATWYFAPAREHGDSLSVIDDIDNLRARVLIAQETHNLLQNPSDAAQLRRALNRAKRPADYWEVETHAWSRPIDARPEVWLEVAKFFNDTLYSFGVEIGETIELREENP